jgi:uncharacterized protein (DUF4415 family)
VKANNTKKPSKTDWKRVDALQDSDIDFSDSPERKHARGYQTTMNAVLRKYMEARKERQRA